MVELGSIGQIVLVVDLVLPLFGATRGFGELG